MLCIACGPGSTGDFATEQGETAADVCDDAPGKKPGSNTPLRVDDLDVTRVRTVCPQAHHSLVLELARPNYVIAEATFDVELGNLKMSLFDASGELRWSSTGGDFAAIHRLLDQGTYTLQLESLSDAELTYTLRVRGLPAHISQ